MKLVVASASVIAEDMDDLNALSVELRGVDMADAAKLLGAYGRMDADRAHVWLDINMLRSFAPLPRTCSWDERFAGTVAYAVSKGWTDESGQFVRAHIER